MGYELVSFKGIGDGVKIKLDKTASIYEIIDELERKISSSKAFFGAGDCSILFDGRNCTISEKRMLKELMCRLLPLCNVVFMSDERKASPSNDWIVEYKEKHEKNIHPADCVTELKKPRELKDDEFISILRSNRARLFQGVVHDGMTLRSDGHLILLGMVEKGAEVIAVGNILVVGGLYGKAHAGCNGHNGSYILAMDMKPECLAIAEKREEYSYEQTVVEDETMQEEDKNKKGFFGKFKKKDEEETNENAEKDAFSAVALLKNNKIILDNFTIQTFTNLKNMV